MSQYPPPPYSPPPGYTPNYYGYPIQVDYFAPAKRASVLMFILGGLFLVCGGFCGVLASLDPAEIPEMNTAEMSEAMSQLDQAGLSWKGVFGMGATVTLVPGIAMIVLGFLIRRGGLGITVVSIVLTSILLLGFGGFALLGLIGMVAGGSGNPSDMIGLIMFLLPAGLLAWLLIWQIQAARACGQIVAMREQAQAQYWQYQQQQQQIPQPPQYPPETPGQT